MQTIFWSFKDFWIMWQHSHWLILLTSLLLSALYIGVALALVRHFLVNLVILAFLAEKIMMDGNHRTSGQLDLDTFFRLFNATLFFLLDKKGFRSSNNSTFIQSLRQSSFVQRWVFTRNPVIPYDFNLVRPSEQTLWKTLGTLPLQVKD